MVMMEPLGGTTPPMVVTAIRLTMPRTGDSSVVRSSVYLRPRTTDDRELTSALTLASCCRLPTM
ncbi:hypothetical protein CDEF62S_02509 [Castellaniella defragrans]